MRKEEYINRLAQGLRAYDKTYVEDVLRDYEEHFLDAAQEGKQEEEICEELGSPEDVVQEIKELLLQEENDYGLARPQAELMHVGGQDCRNREWKPGELTSIRFFTDTARVRVIPSRDGAFHLHLTNERDRAYLEESCTAGAYYGQLKRKWWQILGVKSIFQPFGEVLLEIPENLEELQISTVTGELYGEEICGQSLRFGSISGAVCVQRIKGERILLSSVSRSVQASWIEAEQLTLRTTSGALKCRELWAKQLLGKCISGAIEANGVDSKDIYLKTVSGSIRLQLKPHSVPIQFQTRTMSGQICIDDTAQNWTGQTNGMDGTERIQAMLHSVSGNITVTGEG